MSSPMYTGTTSRRSRPSRSSSQSTAWPLFQSMSGWSSSTFLPDSPVQARVSGEHALDAGLDLVDVGGGDASIVDGDRQPLPFHGVPRDAGEPRPQFPLRVVELGEELGAHHQPGTAAFRTTDLEAVAGGVIHRIQSDQALQRSRPRPLTIATGAASAEAAHGVAHVAERNAPAWSPTIGVSVPS